MLRKDKRKGIAGSLHTHGEFTSFHIWRAEDEKTSLLFDTELKSPVLPIQLIGGVKDSDGTVRSFVVDYDGNVWSNDQHGGALRQCGHITAKAAAPATAPKSSLASLLGLEKSVETESEALSQIPANLARKLQTT